MRKTALRYPNHDPEKGVIWQEIRQNLTVCCWARWPCDPVLYTVGLQSNSFFYVYIQKAEHTTYSWNIKWQKYAHMGLNGFHIR